MSEKRLWPSDQVYRKIMLVFLVAAMIGLAALIVRHFYLMHENWEAFEADIAAIREDFRVIENTENEHQNKQWIKDNIKLLEAQRELDNNELILTPHTKNLNLELPQRGGRLYPEMLNRDLEKIDAAIGELRRKQAVK